MKNIILLNDKQSSHLKYRLNIYKKLKTIGFDIKLLEIFSFKDILIIIFTKNHIISSNIKCNILVLFFCKKNSTVILNGLGRYRNSAIFRRILGFLLKNYKGKLFIQNYHDFRYFKFKYKIKYANWLPGSGAYVREKGNSKEFFTVTREDKILHQISEIKDFSSKENAKINIVGVSKIPRSIKANLYAAGIVNQTDIFKIGHKFIWFGGYGDGFPYSLAEALYNGLEVIVSRRQYVQLGLRKIVINKSFFKKGWFKILQVNKQMLSSSYITDQTLNGIIKNE